MMLRRTNIYLPDDQLRALKRLGAKSGAPVSELVREAIGTWLQRKGVRLVGEDEWRSRFRSLLERRRRIAGRAGTDPQAAEADVLRAVREVRRARAARRR